MSETERNLKVAKECGAILRVDDNYAYKHLSISVEQLDAYAARICADKDAEIARLLEESGRLHHVAVNMRIELQRETKKFDAQLSEANALIAKQAEASEKLLHELALYHVGESLDEVFSLGAELRKAISASAESVAAWEAEKLLPLQRQVAMLNDLLKNIDRSYNDGAWIDWTPITKAINDTQATAEVYDREHAAKVLEEAKSNIETMNAVMKVSVPDVIDSLQQMADEALAANKKEGE